MSNFVLMSDLIILYHFPAGIATSWQGNFLLAQVAGARLLWLGGGLLRLGGGLPAGVSACGEVAGCGGCLLGFRLAGVAGGAGGWLRLGRPALACREVAVSARWCACFGLGPGPLWFGACGWGVVGEISVGAGFG